MTIAHTWVTLIQSLAVIALVLTALGLMQGMVKPADALKHVLTILGMVIVLMLIPYVFVNLWTAISLWQWIGLAVIGIVVWPWRRAGRWPRNSE
ncbi:MAG: hypothetical protein ABSG84_10775 [Acidobacteriaceae bacterium]|jgi:hypothetical protein